MEFGKAEYAGFVGPNVRRILDSVVHESLQAPLRLMALETGGRAIVNQNEILPALVEASADFRSFYSLGIASSTVGNQYHEIEVKLREPERGLQVRHRQGYRTKSADTRIREGLRSALLYSRDQNPGVVDVAWGRAERKDDGNYLLPVRLSVPLQRVTLLPTSPGKHEAQLRLYFAVVGADGEASAVDSFPIGLRLADEHVEAARKESLVHTHQLLVDPGERRVGVAIVDTAGGESWVVTKSLRVGG
jgi:hypothetical protein